MTFNKNPLPKPLYLDQVQITDGFWAAHQSINRTQTIPSIYEKLQNTGHLAAWDLDSKREHPEHRNILLMFWDSDLAKWLEAAAYSLHTHPDPELEKQVDAIISLLEKAQQADGYLNSYFISLEPENKWKNLRDWHELYNAGHMIEAAIAYHKATSKRTMLDIILRFANLIDSHFGSDEDKKAGYPGHPELELALVKLYRETGEDNYLKLSKFFIDQRGQQPHYFDGEALERGDNPASFWAKTYHYCQAHEPIREQEEVAGHSVRACYLYAAIADIALETQDEELRTVSHKLWDDLSNHHLYITGGLGPAHSNEGFTFAYDLPNETAYAETCASIALAFWAQRMFHLDPQSHYIDVMERALYNNILSGVSYEGNTFFYANPLSSYPYITPHGHYSRRNADKYYRRREWFSCACCPPNLSRIIAGIGSYFYSCSDDRLYVHLYNSNNANFELNGANVKLSQHTDYPWDGTIQLTLEVSHPTQFELALRIPAWCCNYTLELNGNPQPAKIENGYAIISREWQNGDTIQLMLDMSVERIIPHPEIRHNAGHIALQRGPIVFCLEEVDNGAKLANVIIPNDAELSTQSEPDLFGGINTIVGDALRRESLSHELYQPQSKTEYSQETFQFKAIPYFLWANRTEGEMRVWIRES